MNKTAVEWLIKELTEIGALNINGLHWSDKDDANSAIQKAKKMEKQQIIDAFENGAYEIIDALENGTYGGGQFINTFDTAEQYYDDIFKQNNNGRSN